MKFTSLRVLHLFVPILLVIVLPSGSVTAADFRLDLAPGNTLAIGTRGALAETTITGDLHIDIVAFGSLMLDGDLVIGPEAVLLGSNHLGLFDVEGSFSGLPAELVPGQIASWLLSGASLVLDRGRVEAAGPDTFFDLDLAVTPLILPVLDTPIVVDIDQLFSGDATLTLPLDLSLDLPGLPNPLLISGDLNFVQVPVPEPGTGHLILLGLSILACGRADRNLQSS